MRKWSIRISIALASLILLVIIIVQAVLWSPLPKRIVTEQIEKELGLRISCDKLTTGWLGKSELTNVSLGLPLTSADFLKVKSLKIKHSSLIGLALGHVTVDSVEVDDPVVEVVQSPQGDWNLAQVAVLLGRLGGGTAPAASGQGGDGGQSGGSAGKGGVPVLPIIRLNNGTVHLTNNQNKQLSLSPVNVTGDPQGTLVWNYDLSIGNSIALNGKVAPGGNWQHQLTLNVRDLDPLVKNLGISSTYSANVKASWFGQLSGGKVTGTLVLDQVVAKGIPTLGDVAVHGSVGIESAGSVVTVHPNQVVVQSDYVVLPQFGIQSGSIVSDASGLHADSVKVAAFGGLANMDARFDPASKDVDLQANWSGLSLAKKTNQSGSLTAKLRQPFAGQPVISVELNSNGTLGDTTADAIAPPSHWNAKLNLTGQGSSWKSIDWVLTAPQLRYASGKQDLNLSQLSAHVSQRLPIIELTDLSLPPTGITGGKASTSFTSSGKIDLRGKIPVWNFDANGSLNTSFQQTPVPITVDLHAHGTNERCDLKTLKITMSDITVAIDGSYDASSPEHAPSADPVKLSVSLRQEKRILPNAPIQGQLSGDFSIVGALFKKSVGDLGTPGSTTMPVPGGVKTMQEGPRFRPYLTTKGSLQGSDVVLFGRPVGDINIDFNGNSQTPDQPDDLFGRTVTRLQTTQFFLFQAPWTLEVNYPNQQGVLEVVLETHRLPLDDLAKFAKIDGIGGQVSAAKWVAKIPSLSLDDLDLSSEYHLDRFAGAGITTDSVDINLSLKDAVISLNPLLAKSGVGTVTATASFDLKQARFLTTQTSIKKWPYVLSSAVTAEVNAESNLKVDLKSHDIGASGTLNAQLDLLLTTGVQSKFAHAELDSSIHDRDLNVDRIECKILNGTASGKLKVNLDKPLLATGQVLWQKVDAAVLSTFIPAAEGLAGTFSGAITISPARDPRPLAPVRIDINVASTDGHFRSVVIGGKRLLTWHAVAYMDFDRLVLDHSDLFIAGGLVKVWGRVDKRRDSGLAAQADIQATGLQLDQLAHVDPSIKKPMPGRVDLHVTSIRSGPDVDKLLLLVHADLTHTDLGNFGPIAALYNVMNAAGGISDDPTGYGSIDMSFEQNVLHVNTFRYYNRGIDAHGLADIGPINYEDFGATPIGGQVVGSVRALKNSRIKLFRDFDQYVSALQTSLTTINVVGTKDNLTYPQAGLADIGVQMRRLLVGDARQGEGGQ